MSPLSHNAGLVGWVPDTDTLHQLIREYRDARKVTACCCLLLAPWCVICVCLETRAVSDAVITARCFTCCPFRRVHDVDP